MKNKQILFFIFIFIPALGFGKISQFNEMISENLKEERQLHAQIKGEITGEGVTIDDNSKQDRFVVVERESVSYDSPTKKELLRFKKEKKTYAASRKKQVERLATEIRDSSESF